MLREISLPSIFTSPRSRTVRATGLRQESKAKKAAVIFLAALSAVLLFSYVLGVNNYASTGYEIKTLQNKISALNQENKKLNLSISEKASVSNYEAELAQSGFTQVKGTTFLQAENQYSQR